MGSQPTAQGGQCRASLGSPPAPELTCALPTAPLDPGPQPSTCARPAASGGSGPAPPNAPAAPSPGRMAALPAQMCEAGAGPGCAGLREGPSPAPRPAPLPAPLLRLAAPWPRRGPSPARRAARGVGEAEGGGGETEEEFQTLAGLPRLPARPQQPTLGLSLGQPICCCQVLALAKGVPCTRPLSPLTQNPTLPTPFPSTFPNSA